MAWWVYVILALVCGAIVYGMFLVLSDSDHLLDHTDENK